MHVNHASLSLLKIQYVHASHLSILARCFNKMYSFSVSMVQRGISEAQSWQIIGMHTTGMSFKAIGCQMGYHYDVVSRLVRKHTQTNTVKDLPRSGRPRLPSHRDDRALQRLVRRMPFATSPILKQHWLPNSRLSTRTVRNRLKSAGLRSRGH